MHEPDWSDVIEPTYDPVVELGVSQEDYDHCVALGKKLELTEDDVIGDLDHSKSDGFDAFLEWWLSESGASAVVGIELAYVEAIQHATK